MNAPKNRSRTRRGEKIKRLPDQRRSFAAAELPDEEIRAIAKSRMHARHKHLDALLDRK
jgi:hypothetical protein